jgi:tellurium resistance protein TerZ
MCVGVNWGAIEKKGMFGGVKRQAVDLDASVGIFDANGTLIETISFRNLSGKGIRHSGDDREGDTDGDDGLDNEVIQVDLNNVDDRAQSIVFVLNSFTGIDFKEIPFASVRLYEGTPERVDDVVAKYDIANDSKFSGSVSMVLGKLYRHGSAWKFSAIGDATSDRNLDGTLSTVKNQYL